MVSSYGIGQFHIGRLKKGEDLLRGLTEVVEKKNVRMGVLFAIGALSSCTFAYYDQVKKEYRERFLEKRVEILSLIGNVSLREGKPFIHAHILIGDESGIWGGHLLEGSKVFALEYHIVELVGSPLVRVFDPETGLFLWNF